MSNAVIGVKGPRGGHLFVGRCTQHLSLLGPSGFALSALALAVHGCAPTPAPGAKITPGSPVSPGVSRSAATAEPNAAKGPGEQGVDQAPAPAPRRYTLAEVGIEAATMDRSVDPCVDFYRFACGGWMARTTVPPGRTRYSRMDEVRDRTAETLRALLEEKARESTETLGRFYRMCTDDAQVDEAGLVGVEPLLDALHRVETRDDLTAALALVHDHGIWAGFKVAAVSGPSAGQGDKAPVLVVEDAILGLPTRDHYLASGASRDRQRRTYRDHVERVLQLAGTRASEARRGAKDVLRIETELARVAETVVAERRIDGWYRPIERAELDEMASAIDWQAYAAAAQWPDDARVGVISSEYLERLNELLRAHSARSWARYLEWRVLDELTPALPAAFAARKRALGAALSGRDPVTTERWQVCVALTDQVLGAQLSRAYAERYLPGSASRAARQAVAAMIQGLAQRIGQLAWLDDAARERARDKLRSMTVVIGDQGHQTPGSAPGNGSTPAADNLAAQVLAARARTVRQDRAAGWSGGIPGDARLLAHHVDGYYDPRSHRLVLGAALLQPPFFSAQRPLAINLGALATLAGHQAIHAIDDLGATFDAEGGTMPLPWSRASQRAYGERAQCLAQAYHGVHPAENTPYWRAGTAREDIADLGGLGAAFRARAAATDKPPIEAGGMSEAQLFFVASAQSSCEVEDGTGAAPGHPRSPARLRVNRALAQLPAFAEAFQCASDTPMHTPAADLCQLWQ